MSLRLPNMLRFTTWMAESLEVLEHSPDTAPSDKKFIAWVRMQRIIEECGIALSLDDSSNTSVSLADERTQALLKSCQRQIADWKRNIMADKEIMNRTEPTRKQKDNSDNGDFLAFLEITYHASYMYLHEIALHPDHEAEDFRPPFFIAVKFPSTQSQTTLTPPYINSIIQCISSADALLTCFLNMSVQETLRCPTLVYVRIVYAAVILIKISISTSMPSSELGKILEPGSNKIDTYLDNLLVHLRAVATLEQGGKHVLSSVFLRILTKLKLWWQHQQQHSQEGLFGTGDDVKQADESSGVLEAWEPPANEPCLDYDQESKDYDQELHNHDREPKITFADIPPQTNQAISPYQAPLTDKPGFFTDFGKGPSFEAYNSLNQHVSQSMLPTSWPTTYASNPSYSQPTNTNYGFTMQQDPNLWTHLVNSELDPNNQDNWMPDADSFASMDYTNIPEFNWATWPH